MTYDVDKHSASLALDRAAHFFESTPLLTGEDVAAALRLFARGELPLPNGEPPITLRVEMR